MSNYGTVTNAFNVNLPALTGTVALVVNCPAGTSVISSFIYRVPGGIRYPFPPGVDVTGWPNPVDRAQWTFFLRNANGGAYLDPVEAGLVCATAS